MKKIIRNIRRKIRKFKVSNLISDWETTLGVGILVLIVVLILSLIFTKKIICFCIILAFAGVTIGIGLKSVAKFLEEEILSGLGWTIVTLGLAFGTILLWPTWMK